MGSVATGVGVGGVRIGVAEKGREEMSERFSSPGDGGRTTSGGDVGLRVLASGAAAKECIEGAEVDVGMVITGGIHISTVVDVHCDSCLCKE